MRNRLKKIPIEVYKTLFNSYADSGIPNASNTHWGDVLNVIVIRCNDIYITNDLKRNNDWLILIYNNLRYIYECTADPKYRKNKIANICEQVYFGNIRNHRGIYNRLAICQDNSDVYVRRYTGNKWYEEHGKFGINIHNPAGFFNSSLGCVILANESRYINSFRPLLREVKKKTNHIPVAVFNLKEFEKQAEAIEGVDIESPNSHKATWGRNVSELVLKQTVNEKSGINYSTKIRKRNKEKRSIVKRFE